MNFLECPKCESDVLVQDGIEMKPHDDRLGGVNVIFQDQNISTNIIYDIKIIYRCVTCNTKFNYKIKNHKGLIKIGIN